MPTVVGIDQNLVKRTTCRHCAAINEYTPGEVVTLWSGRDYGGGPDGAEGFKCAKCNENVILRRW